MDDLQTSNKVWTLIEIKEEIKQLDLELSVADESFRAAVYLLSAAFLCTVMQTELRKFTKYKVHEVYKWNKNARQSKLFSRGKIYHSGWTDKESGSAAFWLDVNILLGLIKRCP